MDREKLKHWFDRQRQYFGTSVDFFVKDVKALFWFVFKLSIAIVTLYVFLQFSVERIWEAK